MRICSACGAEMAHDHAFSQPRGKPLKGAAPAAATSSSAADAAPRELEDGPRWNAARSGLAVGSAMAVNQHVARPEPNQMDLRSRLLGPRRAGHATEQRSPARSAHTSSVALCLSSGAGETGR